jgi:hypothetical protein
MRGSIDGLSGYKENVMQRLRRAVQCSCNRYLPISNFLILTALFPIIAGMLPTIVALGGSCKCKPFRVTALGWFPALICPHYNSEPRRQEALVRMMRRTPGMVSLMLDELAGIEIRGDQYQAFSFGEARIQRGWWSKGEWNTELIAETALQPLQPLLVKPR